MKQRRRSATSRPYLLPRCFLANTKNEHRRPRASSLGAGAAITLLATSTAALLPHHHRPFLSRSVPLVPVLFLVWLAMAAVVVTATSEDHTYYYPRTTKDEESSAQQSCSFDKNKATQEPSPSERSKEELDESLAAKAAAEAAAAAIEAASTVKTGTMIRMIGEHWTVDDMWDGLGCDTIFEQPRPLHGPHVWAYLRGAYVGVVGRNASTILAHGGGGGGNNESSSSVLAGAAAPSLPPWDGNGFLPQVVAQHSDGKGRGVFAAEPIARNTLVWTADQAHTARFQSGQLYRQFLSSIPMDVACDVLQWAYVQDLGGGSPDETEPSTSRWISVDLNEGSYMNTVDRQDDEDSDDDEDSTGNRPNVGCPASYFADQASKDKSLNTSPLWSSWDCRIHYVALRDIRVGEELLVQYGDFAVSDGWADFGL